MLALPSGGFEMSGETKKRAEQDEQGRRGSEVERRGRIEMSGEIKKRGRARWSKAGESQMEQAREQEGASPVEASPSAAQGKNEQGRRG